MTPVRAIAAFLVTTGLVAIVWIALLPESSTVRDGDRVRFLFRSWNWGREVLVVGWETPGPHGYIQDGRHQAWFLDTGLPAWDIEYVDDVPIRSTSWDPEGKLYMQSAETREFALSWQGPPWAWGYRDATAPTLPAGLATAPEEPPRSLPRGCGPGKSPPPLITPGTIGPPGW